MAHVFASVDATFVKVLSHEMCNTHDTRLCPKTFVVTPYYIYTVRKSRKCETKRTVENVKKTEQL